MRCSVGLRSGQIWRWLSRGVSSTSFYDVTVEKYAARPFSPVTLEDMLKFGGSITGERRLLQSARFVQRELPIRLAKRLMDLQLLPYIVVTNPHIKRVYDAYHRAFHLLKEFPVVATMDDNAALTELLKKLLDEQAPLLSALAKGLKECTSRPLIGPNLNLDGFLDNMLRSRISRRVIAEQHICFQLKREGFIGVICTNLSAANVARDAIAHTEVVCRETYGFHPQFHTTGDTDTRFSYIPAHLDYMLFELLKNASRAVVEHQIKKARKGKQAAPTNSAAVPPVTVQICRGDDDVTFKISDQGGGIPKDEQAKVWKYGYTSVDHSVDELESATSVGMPANFASRGTVDPMAGLGFGLPVSRLHAQYFGGNIEMVSMPGYGTDVYLRVHRLAAEREAIKI